MDNIMLFIKKKNAKSIVFVTETFSDYHSIILYLSHTIFVIPVRIKVNRVVFVVILNSKCRKNCAKNKFITPTKKIMTNKQQYCYENKTIVPNTF